MQFMESPVVETEIDGIIHYILTADDGRKFKTTNRPCDDQPVDCKHHGKHWAARYVAGSGEIFFCRRLGEVRDYNGEKG